MFSTTPTILIKDLSQNVISFLTSDKATSWGVVTIIAPSSVLEELTDSTIVICSSDVPGGVSIIRQSKSPHCTCVKNY